MAIDRDLWIDARFNVSQFAKDGLAQEVRWNSHLNADWTEWWLDPKGKDMGPNSQYFQYNIAEAKKLMAAAGYASGFDATSHYPVQVFNLGGEAVPLDGMIQQLGIRIKLNPITDYNGEYIPKISLGQGQFEGWGYRAITGTVPIRISETSALMAMHHPSSGGSFFGYSTNGKNDKSGDPEVIALLNKARAEANKEARKKLIFDTQRLLAKKMHSMMLPGGASGFSMAWPALKNYRVYSGHLGGPFNSPASDAAYRLWLDQTQAPFT